MTELSPELVEKAREIVARHFPDKEGIAAGLWDSHGVMKVTLAALNASTLADENARLREALELATQFQTLPVVIFVASDEVNNIHLDATAAEVTALAHAEHLLVDGAKYLWLNSRTLHFNTETGALQLHIQASFDRI